MYSLTRTVTLKNGAVAQKAIGWAMELTGYINKTYALKVRCGMEMFGAMNICWQVDYDSLDKISELNGKLLQDKNYFAMVEKGVDFFQPASARDLIVNYPS